MTLKEFSKTELDLLKPNDEKEKELQEAINDGVLHVVEAFEKEYLTPLTNNYMISILERLLRFKPITAIENNESDWLGLETKKDGTKIFYHKRCRSVHKYVSPDNEVEYLDADAVICSEDGGASWDNYEAYQGKIGNFPYYPPIDPLKLYLLNSGKVDEDGKTLYSILDPNDEEDVKVINDLYNSTLEKAEKGSEKEKKKTTKSTKKSSSSTSSSKKGTKAASAKTSESKASKKSSKKTENENSKKKTASAPPTKSTSKSTTKKTTAKTSSTKSTTSKSKSTPAKKSTKDLAAIANKTTKK